MRDTSARFACCAQLALVSLEIACDGRTRAGLPLSPLRPAVTAPGAAQGLSHTAEWPRPDPPLFSTKTCDSWKFCTTKHHHRKQAIFDQTPSLEGVNLRPNTITTYK